jgi:hypothetical protein
MPIYKTRWFERWARKQGLATSSVCKAVAEMANGLFDADLGGGLFKKRIARPGEGKSSGFRTLLATNKGNRWVFVFGFPKNARSNIDADEEDALKKLATHLLGLTAQAISQAQQAGELIEVNCHDEEDQVSDSRGRA